MLNECLNLIGDGAFLKEEKPQITRMQIYNDIVKTMYEYFIDAGYDENYSRRWANINAVKHTNKEYYRRLIK